MPKVTTDELVKRVALVVIFDVLAVVVLSRSYWNFLEGKIGRLKLCGAFLIVLGLFAVGGVCFLMGANP